MTALFPLSTTVFTAASTSASPSEDHSPRFRSAAVARMTGIAVATLRVWERRYRVVAPPQSPTGHRLYSSANVRRLGLIRALIDRGHAIGTLAGMDDAALQRLLMAATPADLSPAESSRPDRPERGDPAAGWSGGLAVAAPDLVLWALGRTLPAAVAEQASRLPGTPRLQAWSELAQAEQEVERYPQAFVERALDVLAVEVDTLNAPQADRLLALRSQVSARQTLVVYGFGSDAVVQRLRRQGITVWRGPLGRAEMGLLMRTVLGVATSYTAATSATPDAPRLSPDALSLAARSTSRVLCECPRHLAELIQLLGDFEDYSDQCAVDSPADRQLHDDLGAAARHARGEFEQALRRLAAEEGWALTSAPGANLGAA
ncbi:MerR family transcriptional regulator [Sphaerotilus sp.]|uniref:MerR family transcriptional regulator n=1 Tax=Sphaerotilus sp. TaxID=2093942 RepID=UPI002ACE2EE8|nr:MerR family transcriptional regulator [Sphaerotilus sp.]MDZ7855394.1 MerR family transcriptional regulator [Sphaerotilus sp.]